MRQTKEITIADGDNDLKFRLTQMSARDAQRWGLEAISALASTGILEQQVGSLAGGINQLTAQIDQSGLGFLKGLDADRADKLAMDLIQKTAKRIVNGAEINLTTSEIDACIENMKTLIILEKECFMLNFSQLLSGGNSDSPGSPVTANNTGKRGISVQSLQR